MSFSMNRKLDFTKYEIIEKFIGRYGKKGTSLTYRSILKKYFRILNVKEPDSYFDKKREYKKDVEKFASSMKNEDIPAKTFRLYLACVKKFLQRHEVEFRKLFWEDVYAMKTGSKGAHPVIDDKIPSNTELKKILSHGDILEKSLFTVLASSGMRIGELCKIKVEDVDFKFRPVKIELLAKYTKSGRRRTVFISDEAAHFTHEWLKIKQKWLNDAVKKLNVPHYTKSANDNRVFPMEPGVVRMKWRRLLRDAGFTEKDKTVRERYRLHPHCLRKFFRIKLPDKIGVDLTEGLMGHGSGLTMTYRRYGDNKKKMGSSYLRGMPEVTIFETESTEVSGIKEQLKEKDKQIQDLRNQMEEMRAQIVEMRLEKLENGKEKK